MVRMVRASHVSVDTLVEEPLDTPLGFAPDGMTSLLQHGAITEELTI